MPNLTLTPATVVTARALALWTLRAAATVLLSLGAYMLLQRFLQSLITGDLEVTWIYIIDDGTQLHRPSIALSMLIVGGALAFASALIARWMTPIPAEGCPRCGYTRDAPGDAAAPDDSRCPECGLRGVNES